MTKTNLNNYLVAVAYDGSNFHGWSKQPKLRTVEGEINRVLKKIFKTNIIIDGSSRTDTGVHAYNQFFTFRFHNKISLEKLKKILQHAFKFDIKVTSIKQIKDNYDLRKHVKSKEYRYYINIGDNDPFKVKYEYQYGQTLAIKDLQKALDCFIGRHYFYNFSGLVPSDKKDPYRIIKRITIEQKNSYIIISIIGNGFLRYQVRCLISAAINYCQGKISINEIKNYLSPEVKKKFPFGKVPASGLYLFKTTLC